MYWADFDLLTVEFFSDRAVFDGWQVAPLSRNLSAQFEWYMMERAVRLVERIEATTDRASLRIVEEQYQLIRRDDGLSWGLVACPDGE